MRATTKYTKYTKRICSDKARLALPSLIQAVIIGCGSSHRPLRVWGWRSFDATGRRTPSFVQDYGGQGARRYLGQALRRGKRPPPPPTINQPDPFGFSWWKSG